MAIRKMVIGYWPYKTFLNHCKNNLNNQVHSSTFVFGSHINDSTNPLAKVVSKQNTEIIFKTILLRLLLIYLILNTVWCYKISSIVTLESSEYISKITLPKTEPLKNWKS